jgi:hypothetical protein
MDNKLKTPYSHAIDFSIGRELGRDFAPQVSRWPFVAPLLAD